MAQIQPGTPVPGEEDDTMEPGGDDMMSPGGNNTSPEEPEPVPIFMPPEGPRAGLSPMRLLTRKEYDATVRDLLGVSMTNADTFPAENVAEGFENNAWVHKVSPSLVRSFRDEAEVVAKEAAASPPDELASCAGA
ncbi:MAG: DUF1587 domain-containing protein, partial [Myxococcota bacterium]